MNVNNMAWEGVDWVDVPPDRDKLLAVVDAVMNFRVL
jgi:hypothetical protein